jgi:serine/threonine protein phosphatase PrpC
MQLADTKIETIYNKLKENNSEIIRNSFFLAEDEISMAKFDAQFSGSTTVMVFVIGNKILCANAGDSRAIMICENNKKISAKNFSNFFILI